MASSSSEDDEGGGGGERAGATTSSDDGDRKMPYVLSMSAAASTAAQQETNPHAASSSSDLRQVVLSLPEQLRASYVEAANKIPHVMRAEARSITFLRVENFDTEAAARRLALHWEVRKKLFRERTFLPIKTLGVHSTLSFEARSLLESRDIIELPKGSSVGRLPVIFFDTKALQFSTDRQNEVQAIECVAEALFYTIDCVAAENLKMQMEGFVLLVQIASLDFNFSSLGKALDLIVPALPSRLKFLHLAQLPTIEERDATRLSDVASLFYNVAGNKDSVKTHSESSKDELIRSLSKSGLSKSGLPPSLGGTLSLSSYKKGSIHFDAKAKIDSKTPEASQKKARKRKSDAIYARRKREEERVHANKLRLQAQDLVESNEELRAEYRRLSRLKDDVDSLLAKNINIKHAGPHSRTMARAQTSTDSFQVSWSPPSTFHGEHDFASSEEQNVAPDLLRPMLLSTLPTNTVSLSEDRLSSLLTRSPPRDQHALSTTQLCGSLSALDYYRAENDRLLNEEQSLLMRRMAAESVATRRRPGLSFPSLTELEQELRTRRSAMAVADARNLEVMSPRDLCTLTQIELEHELQVRRSAMDLGNIASRYPSDFSILARAELEQGLQPRRSVMASSHFPTPQSVAAASLPSRQQSLLPSGLYGTANLSEALDSLIQIETAQILARANQAARESREAVHESSSRMSANQFLLGSQQQSFSALPPAPVAKKPKGPRDPGPGL